MAKEEKETIAKNNKKMTQENSTVSEKGKKSATNKSSKTTVPKIAKKENGKVGSNRKVSGETVESKEYKKKQEEVQKTTAKMSNSDKKVVSKTKEENPKTKKSKEHLLKKEERIVKEKEEIVPMVPIKDEIMFDRKMNQEKMKNMKMDKNINAFRPLEVSVLLIITCIISLCAGGALYHRFSGEKGIVDETIHDKALNEFVSNYRDVIENYYGEVDKEEILDAAMKAMIEALGDPHSSFMDEDESRNFNIQVKGSYEGIGIQIANDQDMNTVIISVYEGSPADKAGLQAGDYIIGFDETNVVGLATSEITAMIEKKGNASFRLTIDRPGEENSFTKELKNGIVEIKSVHSKVFERNQKKVAYIKVDIFAANTFKQFQTQLESLEQNGFDSLVIDLRDNSGGHLESVESMLSLFLDKSHLIYQTETKEGTEKFYSTGNVTKKYPIVILENVNSASASEMMIAALKEEYGATIVGGTSFGKGTVQTLKKISDDVQYKITTKKWLTPKGNWIHNKGIDPDIAVNLEEAYFDDPSEETDNQLQTAIDVATK